MAAPTSPLAIAADGVADALQTFFADTVLVSVDTPFAAAEKAKASSKHFINLFFYRVAHSGFHAAQSNRQPLFLRVQCLVTPFPGKFENGESAEPYPDLRILGEAIRFFHNQNVTDPKPLKNSGGAQTEYALECTLLQPNMEELNHIWTTQGSELAYRLSAVYEFSLIPIEPITVAAEPPKVRAATIDISPTSLVPGATTFGAETRAIALRGVDDAAPPTNWLPVVMLREGARLTNAITVAPAANAIDLALAGLPGGLAALDLAFQDETGAAIGAAATTFETIDAALLDDEAAALSLPVTKPASARTLRIRARPGRVSGGANQVEPNAPFSHSLTVTFGDAP
ncbi:Pvc16 family protein [Methylopila sp. M107]|uniref:Pvc16 family protein n=1 Tax=Methylopila sp. M107 TaxID=1101190 RepID=UPI000362151A|nr:Pvc16 family protein [Methylopila sp. M107]